MSELKAFDVGLGQYCEDGSPCVVAFDADRNPRLLNEKVYLKSEADKVIAELEERIAEVDKEFDFADHQNERLLKKLRHSKYKRCLDNAWLCRKLSNAYALSAYTHRGWKIARYYDEKAEFYRKWRKRWQELAEKFKEAK